MKDEPNFLNGSFFKELQFGFGIDIDPADLAKLKVRNGKYRLDIKKSRSTGKWYLQENTFYPEGGGIKGGSLPDKPSIWEKAVNHSNLPGGDLHGATDDQLPF